MYSMGHRVEFMKRLLSAALLMLFAADLLAQPGNPMPPSDPGEGPANVPIEAMIAMAFMLWATLSESGPLHKWAEKSGWLAALAILGVPILVGIIAG